MTSHDEAPGVVSAGREIAAGPAEIFELIADPAQQPRWDGNENLAGTRGGQRVRRAGEVFLMTLTHGGGRENHVLDFAEARSIPPNPTKPHQQHPRHLIHYNSP